MEWLFRQTWRMVKRLSSSRQKMSLASSPTQRSQIEEETMPTYGLYYPVKLGDIFKSRYQVLSKMGYRANFGAWFCLDLEQAREPFHVTVGF